MRIEPTRSTFMDGAGVRIAYYVSIARSLPFQPIDAMTWRAMIEQDLDHLAGRDHWSVAALPISESDQAALRGWDKTTLDAFVYFNLLLLKESGGQMRSLIDHRNGVVRVIRREPG